MRLLDIINSPWAIVPEQLREIQGIYTTHLRGEKIDIKGVEARIGKPLKNEQKRFEVVGSVAILPLDGIIAKKMNLMTEISGGTSTEIAAQDLQAIAQDEAIKAVILSIDSPGGTVDGTPDMADIVYEMRRKKRIVSHTSGSMASGAYWIGAAASHVFISSNVTQVGSIGIVTSHVDVSSAEAQRGIKTTELTAGKYKRIASQFAPLTEEGRNDIQGKLDYLYSVFVEDVARLRGVSVEKVMSDMADGRTFIGRQAIDAGLADGVATLEQLVAALNTPGAVFVKK